jgi:exopolyphosphatase/guanosine-5'-triphosphate,3'-diphosphate pyrophosphatase
MKVGAIDIGTNTVRLLVAERHGGGLFPMWIEDLDRRVVVSRLGQGVDASGRFAEEAIGRTIEVLGAYGSALKAWNVDMVDAVATSATRDAANRNVMLERAELALGFRPRVITGDEEAVLSFNGATVGVGSGPHVVIDPGGGSTEFVSGIDRVDEAMSVDIGSVRLTERLLPDLPATPAQITAARLHVDKVMGDVPQAPPNASALGVGGTFTSLAAIALDLQEYDRQIVDGSVFGVEVFDGLIERIGGMTIRRIEAIPSLDPARAPVLLGGAIVAARALAAVGASQVAISGTDILDGVALQADRPSPV